MQSRVILTAMMVFAAFFLLAQDADAAPPPVDTREVMDAIELAREFETPEERLDARFEALASAETPQEAAPLIDEIQALWAHSGSDTVSLLMDRGAVAEAAQSPEIAARMYDHVNQLDPSFAQGWMASAGAAAALEDWSFALEALNNALTHEPRRFDAYLAIGRLLEQAEEWNAALEAYEAALAIYPAYEPAARARDRIEAARAGRAL